MDLTKIDKPFGELDDATKGALLLVAHRGEVIEVRISGDWQETYRNKPVWDATMVYRVQPKPMIGEVVMFGMKRPNSHILCYDGFAHCELTFTFPTRDGMHIQGVYTSPDGLQIKIEVAG